MVRALQTGQEVASGRGMRERKTTTDRGTITRTWLATKKDPMVLVSLHDLKRHICEERGLDLVMRRSGSVVKPPPRAAKRAGATGPSLLEGFLPWLRMEI